MVFVDRRRTVYIPLTERTRKSLAELASRHKLGSTVGYQREIILDILESCDLGSFALEEIPQKEQGEYVQDMEPADHVLQYASAKAAETGNTRERILQAMLEKELERYQAKRTPPPHMNRYV